MPRSVNFVPPPFLAYAIGVNNRYVPAKFHEYLGNKLEAVLNGSIKRLSLSVPPRHGKSLTTSVIFAAYHLGCFPDKKIILVSASGDLAKEFGRQVRDICTSDKHKVFFPSFSLNPNSKASDDFKVQGHTGSLKAVGTEAQLSGYGGDLIILDDMNKDDASVTSDVQRNALQEWFNSVLYTRLSPDASILLIGTRWAENDIIGYILDRYKRENWTTIAFPALAEDGDVLGRAPGEALWPEWWPAEKLKAMRENMPKKTWSSLYQCRPTIEAGDIFKRADFKYYKTEDNEQSDLVSRLGCFRVIQCWDTAITDKSKSDYSVGITIGVSQNRYYVLDMIRKRLEYPDLKRLIISQYDLWKPSSIFIEKTLATISMIQEFTQTTRLPLIGIVPKGSKTERAQAITPLFDSHLVYFPEGEEWLDGFERELLTFPNGRHDDQVDCLTHGLTRARLITNSANPNKRELTDEEIFERQFGSSRMVDPSKAWMC